MLRVLRFHSRFTYHDDSLSPPESTIIIPDADLRLSLRTTAIRFLMDKISSQIYFIAILLTILTALSYSGFQKSIHMNDSIFLIPLQLLVLIMLGGATYFSFMQ